VAACGDGFVQVDLEACDAGADNSDQKTDACRTDCTVAIIEFPDSDSKEVIADSAYFGLQLGAFTSLVNAVSLRDAAAQVIPGVRLSEAERNGEPLYRVVIGGYETAGQVSLAKSALASAGMGSFVRASR
jgi:cell division protein FtsN